MNRIFCIIVLVASACVEQQDGSEDLEAAGQRDVSEQRGGSMAGDETMLNDEDETTPFQFAVYGIDLVQRGGDDEFETVSIYLSTAAPGRDACARPTDGLSVSIHPSAKVAKESTTVNVIVTGRDESKTVEILTGVVELKVEKALESEIECALAFDGCKEGEAPTISGSLRVEEANMIVIAGSFEATHCPIVDTLTFEEGPGFFDER